MIPAQTGRSLLSPAADAAGLSAGQVTERVAAGLVNDPGRQPTRTVRQILVANIATRFNAVLGGLFIVIAVVGPLQDALFGLVVVANSAVGIIQELRAKRALDRLTVLTAPTAAVLRDGATSRILATGVVLDDIVELLALPGADRALDARELPEDAACLAPAVRDATVIGRVTPRQKRAIVGALQGYGHVVAMTGDGVNDVLALKASDVGIAMGSGTPASRGVARRVLLDDAFERLPRVVAEGRRVIGNVDRVSRLFLTKTSYAVVIALAVAVAGVLYPFYPRHLTIISTLSIGVPAFFLALASNAERVAAGFLARALRFAIPAGLIMAAASFGAFVTIRALGLGLGAARTSATIVAIAMSLFVLAALARPLASWRGLMVLTLATAFAALFAQPWLRAQLAIVVLPAHVLGLPLGIAATCCALLLLAWPLSRRVSR
jgi:magnesium-transporting ATPase (P-type)